MPSTIVLYGATGYSGALVAAELAKLPARGSGARRIVLAGRDAGALHELAEELGCDHTVFALDDDRLLRRALADLDPAVVLNAAGPFAHSAGALAEAAIALGCHYTDINGESDVYQALARLDAEARAAGSALVGSAGFWAAASNLLLDRALDEPGVAGAELGDIRIVMSRIRTFSRGSAATVWRSLRPGVTVARRGRRPDGSAALLLAQEPVGRLEGSFDFADAQRRQPDRRIASAASLVDTLAARVLMLRRGLEARSIASFVESEWPARVAYQAGAYLAPLIARPVVQALARQSVSVLATGPTPEERRDERHVVLLEIEDAFRQPLVRWRWETPNVYQFTASLATAVASQLCLSPGLAGWIPPCEVLRPLALPLDASTGPLRGCRLQRRTP